MSATGGEEEESVPSERDSGVNAQGNNSSGGQSQEDQKQERRKSSDRKVTGGSTRVRVQLRATGGAPMLRRTKFEVPGDENVLFIVKSLRRQLKFSDTDALFLVNGGFVQEIAKQLISLKVWRPRSSSY